jgi:hypothetical protein
MSRGRNSDVCIDPREHSSKSHESLEGCNGMDQARRLTAELPGRKGPIALVGSSHLRFITAQSDHAAEPEVAGEIC